MSIQFENIDKEELKKLGKPLQSFIDDIKMYHDIMEISIRGLSISQAMPKAVDAIEKALGESEDITSSRESAKRMAEIAKKEIDSGFPFFYNQAAIILYSQLEGAIKRFIIEFFSIEGVLASVDRLKKIKIPIAEYYRLSEVEKLEFLFQQYEKNESIGLQYGITRFEKLLEPIGFSGKLDEKIQKDIFELSQIRNILLHRGGIADKYFLDSCPWLNYNNGDKIGLKASQYGNYFKSALGYVIQITIRLGEKRGIDMAEFRQ